LEKPSGKRLHNELERSTIFHGKIHYFYGDFPVRYVSHYQRVPGEKLEMVVLRLLTLSGAMRGEAAEIFATIGGATRYQLAYTRNGKHTKSDGTSPCLRGKSTN